MRSHWTARQGPTVAILGAMALHQLAFPDTAAAYVDPLSGSIVLQVLAAAVLGGIVGLKRSWANVTLFCRRMVGRSPE